MKALCERQTRVAAEREKRNYANWMNALEANKELKKRNTALWQEKEKYRFELKGLMLRNERLEKTDRRRISVLTDAQEELDILRKETAEKDKQIAALKEELCKLKAQIDHDGTTNGIPTSQTPSNPKSRVISTQNIRRLEHPTYPETYGRVP